MSDTPDDLPTKLRASASHARLDRALWAGSKLMEQAADRIDELERYWGTADLAFDDDLRDDLIDWLGYTPEQLRVFDEDDVAELHKDLQRAVDRIDDLEERVAQYDPDYPFDRDYWKAKHGKMQVTLEAERRRIDEQDKQMAAQGQRNAEQAAEIERLQDEHEAMRYALAETEAELNAHKEKLHGTFVDEAATPAARAEWRQAFHYPQADGLDECRKCRQRDNWPMICGCMLPGGPMGRGGSDS